MGLNCKKQVGEFKSTMRKVENKLFEERQDAKIKKKEKNK